MKQLNVSTKVAAQILLDAYKFQGYYGYVLELNASSFQVRVWA